MGYRHKIYKDKLHRKFFYENEMNIILLHYLNNLSKHNITFNKKALYFFKFLRKYHLNSSRARIVNRCLFTGRSS
jgi:hypothetical protein